MSSRKRTAGFQLTDTSAFEDDGRPEVPIEPSKTASAEIMAKRKIAVPRGRRQFAATNGGPSASSNGTAGSIPSGNPFAIPSSAFSVNSPLSTPNANGTSDSSQQHMLYKALNENFANAVANKLSKPSMISQPWDKYLNQYLKYSQSIANGTVNKTSTLTGSSQSQPLITPAGPEKTVSPDNEVKPANPFASWKPPQSTEATAQPFSFKAPSAHATSTATTTSVPEPNSTVKPFSFPSTFNGSAQKAAATPANGLAAAPVPKVSSTPITMDVDDDDSSDDDIKIEGPQFTMTNLPKTKDSPFSFSAATSSSASKPEGPKFVFSGDASKSTSKPVFSLKPTSTPATKDADSTDKPKDDSSKPSTDFKNHTWNPSIGIQFMPKSDANKSEDKPASPFSFKAPTAPSNSPFQFSATKSTTPLGSSNTTNSPFSFSQPPTNGAPLFGSSSKPDVAKPAEQEKQAGEDDETMPPEAQISLSEKGPGEEDEESVYEKRAKVFEFIGGQYKPKGLGILRILVHKNTKKARVLVRAEGSGRPLMNTLLRSQITYKNEGKGNVKVLDFGADGKPLTMLVRVKTADDSQELAALLEKYKS